MNEDLLLRPLTPKDAAEVAQIHLVGFQQFFLSSFGAHFLKVFYAAIFQHANGFGVGVFDRENKLLGFSVGCHPSSGFYLSLFVKNMLPLGFAMLPQLLRSPAKLLRIFNAFRSSGRKTVENMNSATLLSICVRKDLNRGGVGAILLKDFEKAALARGANEIMLTTKTNDNEQVNRFYLRNNYQLLETFVKHQGQKENLYSKKISAENVQH